MSCDQPTAQNTTIYSWAQPPAPTTADRLRARASRLGPCGLDYISAAELRAIADELDGR